MIDFEEIVNFLYLAQDLILEPSVPTNKPTQDSDPPKNGGFSAQILMKNFAFLKRNRFKDLNVLKLRTQHH